MSFNVLNFSSVINNSSQMRNYVLELIFPWRRPDQTNCPLRQNNIPYFFYFNELASLLPRNPKDLSDYCEGHW